MNPAKDNHIILVADDDDEFRLLVRSTLEQANYVVVEAENGETALKKFRSLHPNLVLSDVMMPEMDGFELCRKIRQSPSGLNTPIVIVTALDDVESIEKAYRHGATDFMTKPVDWPLLTMRVNFLIRANQSILHSIQNLVNTVAQKEDTQAEKTLSPSLASLESQLGPELLREMLSMMDSSLQDVDPKKEEDEKPDTPEKPEKPEKRKPGKPVLSGIDESHILILRLQEMQADMEFVTPYLESVLSNLARQRGCILQAAKEKNMQEWLNGFLMLKSQCEYIGAYALGKKIQDLLFCKDGDWFERLEEQSRTVLEGLGDVQAYLNKEIDNTNGLESNDYQS